MTTEKDDEGYLVERAADGHHTVQGDGCEGDEVRRYSGGEGPVEREVEREVERDRDRKLADEIRIINYGRRGGKLKAMLEAAQAAVRPATPPAPVTEPPAVTQMRKVHVTRRPPVKAHPALEDLSPHERWKVDGTPFIGKRQQERAARQAAKKAGYDPISRTHYSGSDLIPDVTDADIADGRIADGRPKTPDLMACPRCNQYNQRTNYACRVCGYEFGISS